MIVHISQPRYLPYMGYLDKIHDSDVFVFADTFNYHKGINRKGLIELVNGGYHSMAVPVYNTQGLFHDAAIRKNGWNENHWETIRHNYSRYPKFKEYESKLKAFYQGLSDLEYFSDVCLWMLANFMSMFGMSEKPIIYKSSDMLFTDNNIIAILDFLQLKYPDEKITYLSGTGGKNYITDDYIKEIKSHGFDFKWHTDRHKDYLSCLHHFIKGDYENAYN